MLASTELRDTCLGSVTAGMVARLVCHPLDTAKARLQGPNGESFRNTLQVLRVTLGEEGVRGLYRGFGAVIVGGTPGTCLYLSTYEIAKDALSHRSSRDRTVSSNFATHFTAGILAETVCCLIYVPVDVVKERLQVQSLRSQAGQLHYKGSLDALFSIARTEGLGGVYKGYGATLASFGPFSALYFMFYEQAKMRARRLLGLDQSAESHEKGRTRGMGRSRAKGDDLPFLVTMANAVIAAAASSWITNPLDIAKLRYQVQRGTRAASAMGSGAKAGVAAPDVPKGRFPSDGVPGVFYGGIGDALRHLYREGGVAALFKGSGARIAFHAPNTAITMAMYEKARAMWASLLERSNN